ncbi:MAG TPA: GAF domain-containing sensor histidine kinase [Gemmatimonadaceae bacterium]|nr:GAF domain-containing sensor histidine kinase [Gemmatimonadaceae bacterium]
MNTSAMTASEPFPQVASSSVGSRALQECVRDLVALSNMPACWIGRSPVAIAESVRDLMVGMLRPDSVYVQLQDRAHGLTHTATAHGTVIPASTKASGSHYREVSSEPLLFDSEVALGLASVPIGLDGELGHVAVGSSRSHFPTRLELLLMQVATNQIAIALRHAELLARHQKMETDLEAARANAEKSSSLKSEFLGIMSHELRTPLNAIGGYVEIMELGVRGPVTPEQLTDLGRIKRSQRHLLSVIENVLGYLKLGSGRVAYEIGDVCVDDVVSSVEEITKPLIDSKGLRYRRQAPATSLVARGDNAKVRQIVLNLFSNAIKFTPEGGQVDVEWNTAESEIRIRVSDTGIGIPADHLHSVFEPFMQLTSPLARKSGGTGLGLSISRDFARGMGGQLLVESEPGRGSAFTLVLPDAVNQ